MKERKKKSSKSKGKDSKKMGAPASEKEKPEATHELRDLQVTSVQLTEKVGPGGGHVCPAPEFAVEIKDGKVHGTVTLQAREVIVDAAIDLQLGFAEIVRRYREWAAMRSCTPGIRELLRKISDDIEEQLSVLDCERTGGSPVVDRDMAWAKKLDAEAVEAGKLIGGLQEDVDELQARVNRLQVERDLLLRIKLERIAEVGDYDGWPENYPSIQAHDDWLRKNNA